MAKWNISPVDSYSYEPLRKQVYNVLREAIVNGEFMPDEKITEMEIAEHLNVSRTPVREAFRMLELEELITIIPQQGVFVSGIKSRKEIDDIFRVRMVLEGLAAYLAALNINEEQRKKLKKYADQIEQCILDNDLKGCVKIDIAFHSIIKEASGNKWLERFLDSLFVQSTRFRMKSLSQEGRMVNALNEHRRLGEAITHGDADLAREYMEEHIRQAWKSILIVFEAEHPEE
ncbi:MAG TPA: GntR family transcriptional regulator [Halanaerobiaceae bacterium]|jgi:DNA-binding GntR family transcriptional regulator|nr:GntR family transcriptional regulator [Bacillota bacterium]HHU91676.1 GntR family transcriptional regulator [Halanaerobiaceae bacterium]HOA40641.1 GntR family transcriptional regulator [Halanaerobiales bacterium]HPZ63128.1 GntR family transcriptional regulator [Halanaerobiales bacterium]HQD04756.1 GntR family transcriptional regulator [Halanaerobiales bacterium]